MSNFQCETCGTICYDTPNGYITGCEHYPPDLKHKVVVNRTCDHCDGYGGHGDGYVPEQKGMLPSMCGYCDGTGVDK